MKERFEMSVYKELIPDHYVGDFVSITIKCRQRDAKRPEILMLETDIDQLLRKLFPTRKENDH